MRIVYLAISIAILIPTFSEAAVSVVAFDSIPREPQSGPLVGYQVEGPGWGHPDSPGNQLAFGFIPSVSGYLTTVTSPIAFLGAAGDITLSLLRDELGNPGASLEDSQLTLSSENGSSESWIWSGSLFLAADQRYWLAAQVGPGLVAGWESVYPLPEPMTIAFRDVGQQWTVQGEFQSGAAFRLTVTPVPEPFMAPNLLMGIPVVMMLAMRKRG